MVWWMVKVLIKLIESGTDSLCYFRGDFVSFVKHMRQKASDLDVDLLLIDTGKHLVISRT